MHIGRRELLGSSIMPAVLSRSAWAETNGSQAAVARDIARYIGYGVKASGGPGDLATGEWMAGELASLGFKVQRQTFEAPFFECQRAEVETKGATMPVLPLRIVVPTGPQGLAGNLVRVAANDTSERSLSGMIAVVELPFGRWSSALSKTVRTPIAACFARGADAVILVTHGPSGEAIALNSDGRSPIFDKPVAIVGPKTASPLLAAADRNLPARLTVTGAGGKRSTFNFIGSIDRKRDKWLVVSTPRSGWFTCAGERGPGVAIWLKLARWAANSLSTHNLAFLCNSGHEYENLGAEHALQSLVPPPADTALWVHLGANAAARDWHDATGSLMPLPSADPQRYLVTNPGLLELASKAFARHPGLESPYSAQSLSAGELTNILKAGYRDVAGVFGAHRFHHAVGDDARCVRAELAESTGESFIAFVKSALASR